MEASPENSNSSHKATYVRNAASAGVSAAVELDPRRATYERPASFKQSTASGSAFPLSSTDKARNLVKKLEEAFPNFVISPSLYAPIVQQPFHPGTGPSKEVVHGFWPAPPPRNTGKGLYPAPLIIPDAPAPADDKRPRVEVFVDNSNVIYTFLNWLRTRPEAKLKQLGDKSSRSVFVGGKKGKMDYTTLFAILERGRNIERRVLVASSPLWQGLEISTQLVRSLVLLSLPTLTQTLRDTKYRSCSESPVRPTHRIERTRTILRSAQQQVLRSPRTRRKRSCNQDCPRPLLRPRIWRISTRSRSVYSPMLFRIFTDR